MYHLLNLGNLPVPVNQNAGIITFSIFIKINIRNSHDAAFFADISKSPYNRGVKGCLLFFYILMGDIAGRTTMSGSEIRKMLPAEALVRAISQTTGMKFGNVKVGFDSFLTV